MFGQAAIGDPRARVGELMRNLRDLETSVRSLDHRDASRASADLRESIGTALDHIVGRFRTGAGYAADEAARISQRANAAGRNSYELLKGEVDAHPLVVLGVAAGIGILLGASLFRRSGNPSSEPRRQRRRIKRRARK